MWGFGQNFFHDTLLIKSSQSRGSGFKAPHKLRFLTFYAKFYTKMLFSYKINSVVCVSSVRGGADVGNSGLFSCRAANVIR